MRTVIEAAAWWVAGTAVWVITLSSVNAAEIVLGAAASLVCALLAVRIRRTLGFRFTLLAQLPRWLAAVPRALVSDLIEAIAFVARASRGRVQTGRRHHRRWPSGESAFATAWRASAAIAVSATPGTIVLDVDPESGDALVHTLLDSKPKLDELATP